MLIFTFLSSFCSPFLVDFESLEGINRVVVPFMACGDLSGFDADKTYPVQVLRHHAMYCYYIQYMHVLFKQSLLTCNVLLQVVL